MNVFHSNVAPRRRVRQAPTEDWPCRCSVPVCCGQPNQDGSCCLIMQRVHKTNPPRLVNCPGCGARRDA